jgi:predicted PurR-regulated permease PerM
LSIKLRLFWVIFAILIFGGMFGIWGMIFGVPAIAALRMLVADYMDDRKMNLSVKIGK